MPVMVASTPLLAITPFTVRDFVRRPREDVSRQCPARRVMHDETADDVVEPVGGEPVPGEDVVGVGQLGEARRKRLQRSGTEAGCCACAFEVETSVS